MAFKIIEALPFPRSSTLHSLAVPFQRSSTLHYLLGQAVATSPPELPRAASELSEGPPTEHGETDSEELPTEHSLGPPTVHSETLPTNQMTTSGHSEPPNTEETSGLPGTEQVDCHNGGGAGNGDPVDVNTGGDGAGDRGGGDGGGDGSSGDGSADDGRLPPSPSGSEFLYAPLFTPMERYNFMYQGDLREGMLFHHAEERFPDGEDPGDVMGVVSYPSGPKKRNFLYSDISQIVRVRQDGTTTPVHTPGVPRMGVAMVVMAATVATVATVVPGVVTVVVGTVATATAARVPAATAATAAARVPVATVAPGAATVAPAATAATVVARVATVVPGVATTEQRMWTSRPAPTQDQLRFKIDRNSTYK